jgi:hypothetical protein
LVIVAHDDDPLTASLAVASTWTTNIHGRLATLVVVSGPLLCCPIRVTGLNDRWRVMDDDRVWTFTRSSDLHESFTLLAEPPLSLGDFSLALLERPLPPLIVELRAKSLGLVFGGKGSEFGVPTLKPESFDVFSHSLNLRVRDRTATFIFLRDCWLNRIVDKSAGHILATIALSRRGWAFHSRVGLVVIIKAVVDDFNFAVTLRWPLLQDVVWAVILGMLLLWW